MPQLDYKKGKQQRLKTNVNMEGKIKVNMRFPNAHKFLTVYWNCRYIIWNCYVRKPLSSAPCLIKVCDRWIPLESRFFVRDTHAVKRCRNCLKSREVRNIRVKRSVRGRITQTELLPIYEGFIYRSF